MSNLTFKGPIPRRLSPTRGIARFILITCPYDVGGGGGPEGCSGADGLGAEGVPLEEDDELLSDLHSFVQASLTFLAPS